MDLINAAEAFVAYFKHSDLQHHLQKTPKTMETRWKSTHAMLESIKSQHGSISALLAEKKSIAMLTYQKQHGRISQISCTTSKRPDLPWRQHSSKTSTWLLCGPKQWYGTWALHSQAAPWSPLLGRKPSGYSTTSTTPTSCTDQFLLMILHDSTIN